MRDRAKILVGNREVVKRYIGSSLVWELASALLRYETTVYFNRYISTTNRTGTGFELSQEVDKKIEKQAKSVEFYDGNQNIKVPIIDSFIYHGSFFLINKSDFNLLISKFGSRKQLTITFYG